MSSDSLPYWLTSLGSSPLSRITTVLRDNTTEPKLVARLDRFAVHKINFHHLLAVDGTAFLITYSGYYFSALGVNDLPSGRIRKHAIARERDPAWLLA